jgi:hypothetical protein
VLSYPGLSRVIQVIFMCYLGLCLFSSSVRLSQVHSGLDRDVGHARGARGVPAEMPRRGGAGACARR